MGIWASLVLIPFANFSIVNNNYSNSQQTQILSSIKIMHNTVYIFILVTWMHDCFQRVQCTDICWLAIWHPTRALARGCPGSHMDTLQCFFVLYINYKEYTLKWLLGQPETRIWLRPAATPHIFCQGTSQKSWNLCA